MEFIIMEDIKLKTYKRIAIKSGIVIEKLKETLKKT